VVQWKGGPAWLNQHLFKVKPAEGVSHRLLYHILSHAVAEMDKSAHGSTMKHIKRSELKRYELLFPNSRKEQEKIGRVLDTLDTQIQKTEALIAKLEKVKEGLLHDLLTRGIDEDGQLRPSPEQAPELYKESPLGLIPSEWDLLTLGEISQPKQWPTISSDELTTYGYPVYGANGKIGKYPEYNHEHPVVAITCRGNTCGRVTVTEPMSYITGNAMCLDDLKEGKVEAPFLADFLVYRGLDDTVTGSAQPQIIRSALLEIVVPLPSVSEQNRIKNRLSSLSYRLVNEDKNIRSIRSLKDGLMDDLLTGRLRVTPQLDQAQATTPA
jgi:type I restriction enzyme, S subunit